MAINALIWQNMRAINFNCQKELQQFKNPVLIIQGKHDIINKDIAVSTDSLFDNSTLVFIEKAAHYGWLEHPESYFKTITQFLDTLN